MFAAIYIEDAIRNHPRAISISRKYAEVPQIICDNYGEVFNRKAQNFKLQKINPSLILASKFNSWLLPIPPQFGIGGTRNYYFSHMLNCIYDCRYCFLQGMYASANYVLFINYEDFASAIVKKIEESPDEETYFFSGYDCDSLAMNAVTDFTDAFLPLFASHRNAYLELRTKSINIRPLLMRTPFPNCITAFSLTPEPISRALEHKTPSIAKRIKAMQLLQKQGWPIGLRFDPLIHCRDYKKHYKTLFDDVFSKIDAKKLHSVSLGAFRMPKGIFKNMAELYPEEPLFAHGLDETRPTVSYPKELEAEMTTWCSELLMEHISKNIYFPIQG